MSGTVKRLSSISMALCVALLGGTGAFADDTEIYVGGNQGQSVAKPNVLFILDTSGSMGTNVTTTTPFDPAQTYAGSCASNKIFWSTTGRAPDCDDDNWFDATKFRCQAAAGPLGADGVGSYTDRLARWQPNSNASKRVGVLRLGNNNPPHVECQADQGVHGSGTGVNLCHQQHERPLEVQRPRTQLVHYQPRLYDLQRQLPELVPRPQHDCHRYPHPDHEGRGQERG